MYFTFQMAQVFDLNNPKHVEQALHMYFSLPDNSDSEAEGDDGAIEELIELDESVNNSSRSNDHINGQSENICDLNFDTDLNFPPVNDSVTIVTDHEVECDEEWGTDGAHFSNIKYDLPPVKQGAPKNIFSASDREISYFSQFFDNEMFALLVEETNLYARQKRTIYAGGDGRTKNWNDTTIEEMKAFVGCLIIMGIHDLPALSNFWSSDPILRVAAIADVMSSKRFRKLLENIHCNNNETQKPRDHPEYDKLHKLRPLIEKLLNNCRCNYDPSSYLSVDESMVPFKGRSSMKQYMPMKPVKRGYKVWCLCDSQTGYVLNFDVYTGKSNNTSGFTLGEKVVVQLTECVQNTNVLIAFDNFFTTPALMTTLYNNGIYSCGTVRINRKGLPDMMKQKIKLERGEFQFQIKGTISAVKWMDNRVVTLLSTLHDPRETTTVNRKNKDGTTAVVSCPTVVAEYNKIMGGVDRFDQLRERYAVGRRSVKWWHRLLYFLIDLSIVNSFILWKMCKRQFSNQDQLTYRVRLARQLIGGFSSRKRRGVKPSFLAKKRTVPDEVRLTQVGNHHPVSGNTYRRCRKCSTKALEKRTKYMCTSCDVPLCIEPCFRQFHGK